MNTQYLPKCPKCGNPSNCFRKDYITVEGEKIAAIICNGCQSVISMYIDYDKINEIFESQFSDLDNRIDDVERTVSQTMAPTTSSNSSDNGSKHSNIDL